MARELLRARYSAARQEGALEFFKLFGSVVSLLSAPEEREEFPLVFTGQGLCSALPLKHFSAAVELFCALEAFLLSISPLQIRNQLLKCCFGERNRMKMK